MAPHTQTFTAPSTSQSGMLINSGKLLIQHAKSSGHALLPFFDGIYMCNLFLSFGSETAGWKAAGSIIPIHPPAVSSRQPILPSLATSWLSDRSSWNCGTVCGQHIVLTGTWAVPRCCYSCQPSSTAAQLSTQSSVFPLLLPKSLIHVTLLFPQAVLPKDTASCLKSRYTGPNPFRQGCKPRACLLNSILLSSPTAHDRDCTPVVVMGLPESQTHLRHHSGGDKCEKQNQWNGNFCCFLASGTRVGLQRNRHDKTLQYTGHRFTWSVHCMCCLIIQKDAD